MKYTMHFLRIMFICICLFCITSKVDAQWNPNYSIGTITGNYVYSYNQTPDQLVEIYAPLLVNNTGSTLVYQWEQSTSSPVTGFSAIAGATGLTYSFSAPLSQTTYFRRWVTDNTGGLGTFVSNSIKIQVASVNWEDFNYIREHHILTTGITNWQTIDQLAIGQKLQTTTYLDGLGRPIEKVSRETATPGTGSSLWGDMVKFSQYDVMGREPLKYLPYTSTIQAGKFKTAPIADQTQYYTNSYNETSAVSSISFDNSPLNRVMNVKEPGTAWAASAGKSTIYDVNGIADSVQMFLADYVQGDAPISKGVYSANTLYKLTYTDEYGKQVVEYTDKSGKLILKKVQIDSNYATGHSGWICTYQVYDDFGLLRFQIQPEAVKYLNANGWSFAGSNGQQVLTGLCFQYFYDDKGRMVWKKAPGAAALNMVYDIRDRVVFMQDGNQAALSTPQWTTNLYDDLDRPTITALYNTTETIANLQTDLNNAVSLNTVNVNNAGSAIIDLVVDTRTIGANYTAQNTISFTSDAGGNFMSEDGAEFTAQIDPAAVTASTSTTVAVFNNPISSANLNNPAVCTILKYLYYDNYSFTGAKSFNNSFTNTNAYNTTDPNVLAIAATQRTTSYPTGSRVRVLGTNTFLASTMYYDEKGHHIQTLEDNIRSGTDITTNQYYFDGRLLSSCNNHSTAYTGYNGFITLTKYLFDKLGRVITIQKQFGSNAIASIVNYDYDDMGRVKTKHLDPNYVPNNGDLESLNYSFNIHNQITGINKDYALKNPANYNKWGHFFGMYLGFDNRDNTFNVSRLNGHVTGILWNTQGDDAQRKYDYSYDNAGRLINATYKEQQHTTDGWNNAKMDFSVTGTSGQITYDLNGNLLTMLQKGIVPGTNTPITVDDLRYAYNTYSNQLQSVTDQMTSTNLNGQFGDFKDGANAAGIADYVYDANGNVVVDLNKNVQSLNNGAAGTNGISYNYLDKPDQINIVDKGVIKIVYDADGNKLQRTYTATGSTVISVTTYINQFVYTETVASNNSSTIPLGGWGAGTDTLRYINFEEGRIRLMQPVSQGNGFDALVENGNLVMPDSMMGAYDYFIMDYQKNVRMILTEETHQSSGTATMETTRAAIEDGVFGQQGTANEIEATRYSKPSGWTANTTASVSRLGNIAGHNLGPNTLQKVMAGDQVSAVVQYYHQAAPASTSNNLVTNIIGNLVSLLNTGGANLSNLVKSNAAGIAPQINSTAPPYIGGLSPQNPLATAPKAYLTILFFDERFNFIAAADGGAVQQQVAATVDGNGAQLVSNT